MADEVTEETTEEQTTEEEDQEEETPRDGVYPAHIVYDLRKENAAAREKVKAAEARAAKSDEYARALFIERVAATGKLASADELPFDAALLDSPEALDAAIDELVVNKPYLKARSFSEVGQGQRVESEAPADFSMLLR